MDNTFLTATGLHQVASSYGESTFESYVAQMHSLILQVKQEPYTAALNAPFEWRPTSHNPIIRKGILLIHGLMDSPFMMRDLGSHFLSLGFHVRSILLPGHGTVPADLQTVHYQAWLDAAEYGIRSFGSLVDELYVCGFSMGGLLALYHAYHRDDIAGLILLAPALNIKSRWAKLVTYHRMISWAWPRARFLSIFPEVDSVRYLSLASNGAAQVYHLARLVRRIVRHRSLNIPLLMVLSADDETIDTPTALNFFKQQHHPCNQCILYTNQYVLHHNAPIECVHAAVPADRIMNISHVALPISPMNSHYGVQGSFTQWRDASIRGTSVAFGAINDAKLLWQQTTPSALRATSTLRRLLYNPHFTHLLTKISIFLTSIDR